MQLLRTGAFLRAVRAARIVVPTPTPSGHLHRHRVASRCASSHAAAAAADARPRHGFPEQSVDIAQEVDSSKTAPASRTPGGVEGVTHRDRDQELGQAAPRRTTTILGRPYGVDDTTNVSSSILKLVGRDLYNDPHHPICITRKLVESCFPSPSYRHLAMSDPVVTVQDNFDVLGFPKDHPGRSRTDTYYVNADHLLRTHTSAHQHAAFGSLAKQEATSGYTICADVYRRDSIDKSHFPVFHQMEGAKVWGLPPLHSRYQALLTRMATIKQDLEAIPATAIEVEDQATDFKTDRNPFQREHDPLEVELVAAHLKRSLEHLVNQIFEVSERSGVRSRSEPYKARWIEAYFPFTSPSFELEVLWNGEWLELLGCGVVQQPLLNKSGLANHIGWAWGIGIERFAMLLFGIPDIRLFWSADPRFLTQFSEGTFTKFEPFSKFPSCYKDIAFWINAAPAAASLLGVPASSGAAAAAGGDATKASPTETQPAAFHENDIMEAVRDVAGSLVEDVKLVDEFVHPASGRKSLCYRINYRSLERTLTNDEVNDLHAQVAAKMKAQFDIELR